MTAKLKNPVMQALLDKMNARKSNLHLDSNSNNIEPDTKANLELDSRAINLNSKQQEFLDNVLAKRNVVLLGAAGTGKTTATQAAISALIKSNTLQRIGNNDHKKLKDVPNNPGILILAFTRLAIENIKKKLPADIRHNCMTIHAALEFQPIFDTIYDEESGKERTTMRMEETRNFINPLPPSITTIIFEESSMLGLELFKLVLAAIHPDIKNKMQFIFLGDIQQLPPVMGSAILGYAMREFNCIELTEVYRQAQDSPILSLAHDVLNGNELSAENFKAKSLNSGGQLSIRAWVNKSTHDSALQAIGNVMSLNYDKGEFDPAQDAILVPFNKNFGSIEINKFIGTHIARKNNREVYEVMAGFSKYYYSVGDYILTDKRRAIITKIERNSLYVGTRPQTPSLTLDYWGHDTELNSVDELDADAYLDSLQHIKTVDENERTHQASHCIYFKYLDADFGLDCELDDTEIRDDFISSSASFNNTMLSYCITVHKSQGSEFRNVFLALHHSNNTLISRELLYTAITRAKSKLWIICEKEHFIKGVNTQRLKGNTIEEKSEYFLGKYPENPFS